jgi:hypothetical protein
VPVSNEFRQHEAEAIAGFYESTSRQPGPCMTKQLTIGAFVPSGQSDLLRLRRRRRWIGRLELTKLLFRLLGLLFQVSLPLLELIVWFWQFSILSDLIKLHLTITQDESQGLNRQSPAISAPRLEIRPRSAESLRLNFGPHEDECSQLSSAAADEQRRLRSTLTKSAGDRATQQSESERVTKQLAKVFR